MKTGHQRLDLDALRQWESLGYGMFIHFGMSTFDGDELSKGDKPSTFYAPDQLDVEQWIVTAAEAGMKYAVLTAKHVSGHCLWPTKLTDYHVGTSGNKTDVVGKFVKACRKHGIMPGLYYCTWDNHNTFGSITPTFATKGEKSALTDEYRDWMYAQLEELLTSYGAIGEVWIDIPWLLGSEFRKKLYNRIAELQPSALIVMNHGISDGAVLNADAVWPTDVVTIERSLPSSRVGHIRWRKILGTNYYLPGEVNDPIGYEWFYVDSDPLRSVEELAGMYMISRARHANFLLDVPPDRHGLIPQKSVNTLKLLGKRLQL